jgi:1,4-alpha-glucan branching enzyme
MRPVPRTPAPALAGLLVLALSVPAYVLAAAPDNNVEWAGASHVAWQDRRPLCPVGNESFQVRMQTWRDDLTAVRVRLTDGAAVTWIDAAQVATRGPYAVWAAQIPATTTASPSYYFELTDGGDSDYLTPSGMADGDPGGGGWALNFTNLSHAPVGATRTSGGGAVFKVWAPTRSTAHVRGDFNAWGLGNPLSKVGEYFIGHVPTVADRAQYKYFFNNAVWNTDPRGRALNPSSSYNAYVEDPFRYVWASGDFAAPPLERMVIYQLHVGTFSGYNDPHGATPFPARYVDVAARVDHLVELGVNAVMINPFTEFPTDISAGYNPVTQWAPEWKYGTPDQLKFMVDVLHQNGIAVILDVVWNHFSYSDNFLWNYDGSQIYFDTPAIDTPWGSQADFDRTEVRDYFAHSALLWMEEYRIDGFRMDATDYMNIGAQAASGWSLMQRLNDEMDNRWADKVAIAEQLPDDAGVTTPTSSGGAGFDSQYHDAFTDHLRQEIFDAVSGDPEMWRIRDILAGSGAWLSGRRVTNYLELHDEAWPTSGGQRIAKSLDPTAPHDSEIARSLVKLGQGLTLVAPGVPAFLMGAEWLESVDFGAESANRIDWSKRTTYAPIFDWFRDVIELRTQSPALAATASHHLFHLNEGGNVIAFRRYDGSGEVYVCVANFGATTYSSYRFGVPAGGDWQEALNSQAAAYGGAGPENTGFLPADATPYDGFVQSLAVQLPARSLLVFRPAGAVSAPAPAVVAAARLTVAPSPARGRATISWSAPRAGTARLDVMDLAGRRVATLADGPVTAGERRSVWNGADDAGRAVPAGVYFARLALDGPDRPGTRAVTVRFALVR